MVTRSEAGGTLPPVLGALNAQVITKRPDLESLRGHIVRVPRTLNVDNTDTSTQLKVQRDVRAQPRCGRASDSIGVRDVCDGQSLERTVSAIVRSKSLDHRALSMARRTHHGTAQ